jgi:putative heme-binding domain-containing protein
MIHALAQTYDGKDRFFLAAVGIAVGHHDPERRKILLDDFEKNYPGWNEQIASLAWELRPPQLVPLLARRLTDAKTSALQRSQIVDILAGSPDTASGAVLLKAWVNESSPEVGERILLKMKEYLPGKWRDLQKSPELAEVVNALLKKDDKRLDALALIAAAERTDFLPKLTELSQNDQLPLEVRAAAVRALGSLKDARATATLITLTSNNETLNLLGDILASLGRQGTPDALTFLKGVVGDKTAKLVHRQAAVAGLAGSKEGSSWLLDAYQEKKVASDLTADLARLLRYSPFADQKKRAQGLLPAPPKLDPKNLPSIPALLARKGNVERGRQLMELSLKNDVACLKCHIVKGAGGKVGPELSVIGSKASRENLLESIIYPSRAIAHQYESWAIETKQGLSIVGVIAEETPQHLILRDANVKEYKVAKKDIETRAKVPTSIMPDNILVNLPEDDLLDIVDYLYSLKSPALTPAALIREEGPRLISGKKD